MKIKFIVEKMGEGGLFGVTSNQLHVWGNLNKVLGVSDMLREDLKNYPADSQIEHTLNLYQFIVFVRLHTSNKKPMMLFFDAENNEDRALEFFKLLQAKGADKELKDNFMKSFYNIRDTYDDVKGTAELALAK